MWKATLATFALLAGLVSQAGAQQWGAGAPTISVPSRVEASADPRRSPAAIARENKIADAVITEGHIVKLRAALRLTPAQQPLWAPVEAALTDLARQQARGDAAGFTYKLTDRSSAIAATANQLRRLKVVAMPLINSLNDNQKLEAMAFAQAMGLQHLATAF